MKMDRPSRAALELAEDILSREPEFFRLAKRHTGIVTAHSEIWCALNFNFVLPESGVAEGADALATAASCKPFKPGDSIQIKARGSETMHVSFRATKIDWLVVLAYELSKSPVKYSCYCFSVPRLRDMASRFMTRYGESVIPIRQSGEHIRLEWSTLKAAKSGRVRGSTDTWEQRAERSQEILGEGYMFEGGIFKKGITFVSQSRD